MEIIDIDEVFEQYLKTKDDKLFTKVYNALNIIMFSKFGNNTYFDEQQTNDFNDIFQLTMIKLIKYKDNYIKHKGTLTTYTYLIFKRILINEKRKTNNYHFLYIE